MVKSTFRSSSGVYSCSVMLHQHRTDIDRCNMDASVARLLIRMMRRHMLC